MSRLGSPECRYALPASGLASVLPDNGTGDPYIITPPDLVHGWRLNIGGRDACYVRMFYRVEVRYD